MDLYKKYRSIIESTIDAIRQGIFFNHYPELPHDQIYAEKHISVGYEHFKENINKKFQAFRQAMPIKWAGNEESPFLQQSLNILYPIFPAEVLIDRAKAELHKWRKIAPEDRAGLLIESIKRIEDRFYEIAFATMHTTGMPYSMAYHMSGPHAAQRALNAVAIGISELNRFPENELEEITGKEYGIQLDKKWIAVPKGISLIVGCSNFPIRDTMPGIYASLITGNSVIVKPHMKSILPVGIVISEIQKVFSENGVDPNICQIGIDEDDKEFTRFLAEHPEVSLIDFKGSPDFTDYLESIPDKTVFSINTIILDSASDLETVIRNLVISLSLFSGQMNNTPQNIFIPSDGIKLTSGYINYEDFIDRLREELSKLVYDQVTGPHILGSVQNPEIILRLEKLEKSEGKVIFGHVHYTNPEYQNARTASPLLMELSPEQRHLYLKDQFGPVGFIIKTKNSTHSIELAAETARKHGSLYCSAFTTDPEFKELIIDHMTTTHTPVTFDMIGDIYLENSAEYTDYRLTGGNTASRASASNLEFVLQRFTWVGYKQPAVN
jgi:phenylacetic acid degradation protein paaN